MAIQSTIGVFGQLERKKRNSGNSGRKIRNSGNPGRKVWNSGFPEGTKDPISDERHAHQRPKHLHSAVFAKRRHSDSAPLSKGGPRPYNQAVWDARALVRQKLRDRVVGLPLLGVVPFVCVDPVS